MKNLSIKEIFTLHSLFVRWCGLLFNFQVSISVCVGNEKEGWWFRVSKWLLNEFDIVQHRKL